MAKQTQLHYNLIIMFHFMFSVCYSWNRLNAYILCVCVVWKLNTVRIFGIENQFGQFCACDIHIGYVGGSFIGFNRTHHWRTPFSVRCSAHNIVLYSSHYLGSIHSNLRFAHSGGIFFALRSIRLFWGYSRFVRTQAVSSILFGRSLWHMN